MTLSKKEEREVKKVAKELLETLKQEKLVLDWRKRQQSRAAVRLSIEEILDKLPRSYTPQLYHHKCDVVYEHIYDSYFGRDRVFIRPLFENTTEKPAISDSAGASESCVMTVLSHHLHNN